MCDVGSAVCCDIQLFVLEIKVLGVDALSGVDVIALLEHLGLGDGCENHQLQKGYLVFRVHLVHCVDLVQSFIEIDSCILADGICKLDVVQLAADHAQALVVAVERKQYNHSSIDEKLNKL